MAIKHSLIDAGFGHSRHAQCSYTSPLDGWRCTEPAVTGGDEPLCVLHDPSSTKSVDLFQDAIDRRIQSDQCWFDGIIAPFPVCFRGRRFEGTTSFHGARFLAGADFRDTRFNGRSTVFTDCVFQGPEVDFAGATFSGSKVDFSRSRFEVDAVSFERVVFLGDELKVEDVDFQTKRGVAFALARFRGKRASFQKTRFRGHAVFFEGAEFSAEEVDFSAARFECDLLSFEEVVQNQGRFTLARSAMEGGRCSFASSRWNGDVMLLARIQWNLEHLEFRDARLGLASLLSLKAARVSANTISFQDTVFLVPSITMAWAAFTARDAILFNGIDWEGEINGNGLKLKSPEVSLRGAHFGGKYLELTSSRIQADLFDARECHFLCSRVSFSNATLHIDRVDFRRTLFAGSHIYFHRLIWSGDSFLVADAEVSAKRFSFNRSVLRGREFSLSDSDLGSCQVSFWETDFGDTRLCFSNLKGAEAQLRFKSRLNDAHFDRDLSVSCDFNTSRWPGEGFLRRPKVPEELSARTSDDYIAAEETYIWIARQFERSGRLRRANDFYYSANECRRRRYAIEGRHADRWKMEMLKWFVGYRLSPCRYAPLAIALGFLSSVASGLASWLPSHKS